MSLAELLHALRVRWLVVVLAPLLGLAAAAGLSWQMAEQYEARTQLFVSMTVTGPDSGSQLAQGSFFTQERVKSYADIVTSPLVLDAVREDLDLSVSTQDLAERIAVTSPLDTVLLDIVVTDTDPDRAREIAASLAHEFPIFVDRLEVPAGSTTSPVKVSTTGPATVDRTPVSPVWPLNLATGLALGLALGLGWAVVRQLTDRTIRTRTQVTTVTAAPALGMVPEDPAMKDTPLIVGDGATLRAEAYRQLRTNIRFLAVDKQLTSFVVTGSIPGEGKTTTAANLAIAMAQAGQAVVLVDADMRRPRIADTFAISGGVGLSSVLLGDVTPSEALHRWRADMPLYLMPSGPLPPNPSELLATNRLRQMLEHFRDTGTIVVFDSPPLLPVTDAAVLSRETDGAIVVTGVGRTRTDQLATAVEAVRTAGGAVLGVVANRVKLGRRAATAYAGYAQATVPATTGSR